MIFFSGTFQQIKAHCSPLPLLVAAQCLRLQFQLQRAASACDSPQGPGQGPIARPRWLCQFSHLFYFYMFFFLFFVKRVTCHNDDTSDISGGPHAVVNPRSPTHLPSIPSPHTRSKLRASVRAKISASRAPVPQYPLTGCVCYPYPYRYRFRLIC